MTSSPDGRAQQIPTFGTKSRTKGCKQSGEAFMDGWYNEIVYDGGWELSALLFTSSGQCHRYLTCMIRIMKKDMKKHSYSRNRTEKRSINGFQPVFIRAVFYEVFQRVVSS